MSGKLMMSLGVCVGRNERLAARSLQDSHRAGLSDPPADRPHTTAENANGALCFTHTITLKSHPLVPLVIRGMSKTSALRRTLQRRVTARERLPRPFAATRATPPTTQRPTHLPPRLHTRPGSTRRDRRPRRA